MQLSVIVLLALLSPAATFTTTGIHWQAPAVSTKSRDVLSMKVFDWKRRGEVPLKADGGVEFTANNIVPAPGSRKRKVRKGRGISAGQGATCGFGMRGQKSRAGPRVRAGFEGGQTPLYRRTPKLRGKPIGPGHQKTEFGLLKTQDLNKVMEGSTVSPSSLLQSGVITKNKHGIFKFVCDGEVSVKGLTVQAHAFSETAKAAIENAGGKCVVLSRTTNKPLEA
jgi:large subunit ribosomal protein L15